MVHRPRHIQTAGAWRETEEGVMYAAVAKSDGEILASADVTLMAADVEPGVGVGDLLAEPTRREIEREIEEVVRRQAVRVLNRREEGG